ncbi:translocation/assembly module TamB domain-containing protein [Flavobacterium sp.]|uniref:translocation/assembly module TamB domain-containing protein n=1 Tax=Flavobacterium sp. TaxID=239 RepID=UPI002C7FE124|nr:translocation/assembly module TamB domain-containing protein [Flavobacterium sp.]HSD08465.1 translocation/assembly module TamB domain-containing protein [Flavobacterium sp.]
MNSINKDFGLHMNVDEVQVTLFGGVKLKKVLIIDHHKDTLIYVKRINTSILGAKKILDGDLIFDDIALDGVLFNLKTYKNENKANLDYFIDAFGTSKTPSKKKFLLTASSVDLSNGRFVLINENHETPKAVDFTRLKISLTNFKVYGPEIYGNIQKMSFLDHRGVYIKNLKGNYSFTQQHMILDKMELQTEESNIKGYAALNYEIDDFSDFENKVEFDFKLKSAKIASNDIRCFYNELGRNRVFKLRSHITGPLNNLKFLDLSLKDNRGTRLMGFINFKNLLGDQHQKFYMNGKFDHLSTNYNDLVNLLPNVLGKSLPVIIKKFGNVSLIGNTQVTTTSVKANFAAKTALGVVKSKLSIVNMNQSDRAAYVGYVVLNDFNIGELLDNKNLSKVSLNIDVDGKGFSEKYLDTSLKGVVSSIAYNGYNYKNIDVNGNFKLPLYKGSIIVNDPNLKMNFDGLVNLSNKESQYDFKINVGAADLHKLNFVKDTLAKFNGDAIVDVQGNSIENLHGNIFINNATYVNSKNTYQFNEFNFNSSFDEKRIRTIKISAPDITNGTIVGNFRFAELKNLVSNSLGSLYTNYKPVKVKKGQFLKFNFEVYDKIVEVFFPEMKISENTVVKGVINSDNNEFKFNFNSPTITASNTTLDNIRVSIDNKNPLYNTYIELDSIKTKMYKIRDFSLINVTSKDTLFFRTEFKGGSKGNDFFNLDLYHTIDKDNKNIIGFSKSEIKLKNSMWFLNESNTPNNRLIFDKNLKEFKLDDFILSNAEQEVKLNGEFRGDSYKDLNVEFQNFDINALTSAQESFDIKGNLNGKINFNQNKLVYKPTASLVIDDLKVNGYDLGVLNFDIKGDESFKKFTLYSTIENENLESFNADGNFEIVNKETLFDLNFKFDKFNLAILSPLGGDVISNIRGLVSGNATIGGSVKKPDINGRLYVNGGGLTVPYLNVDYALKDKTIIDLTDEKFLFRNNTLTDTKFKTVGTLNGVIEHKNFSDWKLDLAINSKRFLVLDTQDSEDAAYFGTAFINGDATIKGPTSGLVIKVDAKSEKGTILKIPINNAESVSENSFIHFITPKEKFNLQKGIAEKAKNYNGLELEFDLEITPNAEVEVILDRNSGHGMKGRGNGNLLFKINTLGNFNMWGDFLPYDGTYNFKYGGLIDKKFNVRKGGSIVWEGDPMRAQLNLEAVYQTSANPALLIENSSVNKKVDVEVVIGIHGDLTRPEPDFFIDFPTIKSVLKSELQTELSDKDVRQTQALYLLSTGSFLSKDGSSQAVSSSLYETASSMLGDIVHSNDEKFEMNFNVVSPDNRPSSQTDGRVEAIVSSKVNERITINGKIGVPFGGVHESSIVGDIDIKYRVNEDGSFNLHFFNKENDINYIGQDIGYTQGVGISYEVDFDTFSELVDKMFKSNKLTKPNKTKENIIDTDSNLNPDFINFTKPTEPKTEKPKVNRDAVLPNDD